MSPLVRTVALLRGHGRRAALAVMLAFATLAAAVGLMGTSAWLIATAALHPSIGALQVAVVGVRFFGIARGVFRYLERLVSHDVTFRLLARLRVDVYRWLVPLSPSRLVLHRTGDLFARLVGDVDTLEHAFLRVVSPAGAAALAIALTVVLLAVHDAVIAGAAALLLVVAAVGVPWASWRLGRRAGEALIRHRGALHTALVDVTRGVADLVAFGAEGRIAEGLEGTARSLERAQLQAARATALGASLVSLLADLAVVAVVALAIPLVRDGAMEGVALAVVALLTLASFEAVAPLPAAAQGLSGVRVAADRVFRLETMPAPVADPVAPRPRPGRWHVTVRGLRYTHPGRTRPALDGVDLDLVGPGLVAIVGPSGSGKSTLVHLLLRFLDAPPGTILVDGIDIREFAGDDVRAGIAYMAQQTALVTGTIADNLRFAQPSATRADLDRAVRLAGFGETLDRLGGHDTWIGEQGAQLSGGERQRLALARTLLRDAPIIILDEPTAGADAATERAILDTLEALARDRAVLLVTHRVAGLGAAREVVVLHDGRVVERGRFADLVARESWVRAMWALERDAAAVALGATRPDGSS